MVLEVLPAELVLDQAIGGGGVGHTQQGFGEHHQGEAFLGRQRVLPKQRLHVAEPAALFAHRHDEIARQCIDSCLTFGRQASAGQHRSDEPPIVGRIISGKPRKGSGHEDPSSKVWDYRALAWRLKQ